MKKRESVLDAMMGIGDVAHPVEISLSSDATVRAELKQSVDGRCVTVVPRNSPEKLEKFYAGVSSLVAKGEREWSVNVAFYKYNHNEVLAHVGWLREAYLVAFAVLGYRYILDPVLELVRQELARPHEELIPAFKIEDRKHSPDLRLFCIVNEPDWIRSVAVQFGYRTVFLPQIGEVDLYERLDERRQSAGSRRPIEVGGTVLEEWPSQPMHILDFLQPEPLFVVRRKED